MERDAWSDQQERHAIDFNSHAHVERDPSVSAEKTRRNYFNSHAHVERDGLKNGYVALGIEISTHTLTWSVTSDKHA